ARAPGPAEEHDRRTGALRPGRLRHRRQPRRLDGRRPRRASGNRLAVRIRGRRHRRRPAAGGPPAAAREQRRGRMKGIDPGRRNRAVWDGWAPDYVEAGRREWASAEPVWGIWGIAERTVGAVPDVAGRDVVELGCGTAYWSAWFARRGARPVGIDNSS